MRFSTAKLKFNSLGKNSSDNKNQETLLYWPASYVPTNANFEAETSKDNKITVTAQNVMKFSTSETDNDEVDYYLAQVNHNGKLVCQSARMLRMFPSYDFKDVQPIRDLNLSKREQLDELKEKFGSKKTQRDLANKRKYEIQFGENDSGNLPQTQEVYTNNDNGTNLTSTDSTSQIFSKLLPQRNSEAKLVEDVYSLNDIITDVEADAIKEHEEQLFESIKCDYVKSFVSKTDDSKVRQMAIYADLLIQLVKLSASQMQKSDPLPLVEGDIKKLVFERYTSTRKNGRSLRYIITDENKDRIFILFFILVIMLNRYKPIELEKLQTYCKIPLTTVRRMLELLGCYIENMRNSLGITSKVAVIKLPLNVIKETKKKFRR